VRGGDALVRECAGDRGEPTPTRVLETDPLDDAPRKRCRPTGRTAGCAAAGGRSLSVTADTYTPVLVDDRELEHGRLVAELRVR
jgi:hypothetical protein